MTITLVWIVTAGLTFFPGNPHWYELDTAGVVWTVHSEVAADVAAAMAELCREADEACTENIGSD